MSSDEKQFLRDFYEAPKGGHGEVAKQIEDKVFAHVMRDLRPAFSASFARLVGVHLLSSAITLSVCPQFGLRLIGEGHGLMRYFMPLGQFGCFLLCGAFYLMVTVFLGKMILAHADWRMIREHYALSMLGLSVGSLLSFSLIQGQFFLGLSLMWMVGALGAAYLSLIPLHFFSRRTQLYR